MPTELIENFWRRTGCTEACAVPVPCPDCGDDLPPIGRSVPLERSLPSCCERHRITAINTRHLWSASELEGR